MSTKEMIEKYGTDGLLFSPTDAPFWRPCAGCTVGERAGASVAYPAVDSREEAFAELRRQQSDPEQAAKYDDWYVVRFEPSMVMTIETEKSEHP